MFQGDVLDIRDFTSTVVEDFVWAFTEGQEVRELVSSVFLG